jgi:hypothetical protein
MEDLGKDHDALTWFNLSTDKSVDGSTPPLPEPPSTPSAAAGIRNRLSDQFLCQWPSLNTWEIPSKIHFMTAGLASPPDSRYNSPIFPFGSSSSLQRGNASQPQCVNPRDLHDSAIDDDQVDQHDSGITEPSPPATDGPPSSPFCVSEKLKSISLRYDNNDEDATMDATMGVPASLPSSQEDDVSVVGRKPESISLDDINNEEDAVMDNATIMAPPSSVPLSQGDDLSMVGIDSGNECQTL